jgi:FixJ family two-component response regulator
MPGGSGLDVLRKMKVSANTNRIPILIVSGNGGAGMRELVKRLDAADSLEEPVDGTKFGDIVSSLTVGTDPANGAITGR